MNYLSKIELKKLNPSVLLVLFNELSQKELELKAYKEEVYQIYMINKFLSKKRV